jgi:3-phenylpropionate/trans-cinnamate dioxygenase ferredoxin reductase component
MSEQTFIIVGASLAGASAAAELREQGFEGRVVLIGSEPQRPYQRPPLSKDYLRGDAGLDKVYLHDESFYADHDIELRTPTPSSASSRRRLRPCATAVSGCVMTGSC